MKIWQKLALAWGITSSLLGVVSLLTIRIDREIQSQTNQIVRGIVLEAKAAGNMLGAVQYLQNYTKKILIEIEKDSIDLAKIEQHRSEIKKQLNTLQQNIIAAKQATNAQKELIQLLERDSSTKQLKTDEENEQIEQLNTLIKEFSLYKNELNIFLEDAIDPNRAGQFSLENDFTNRMSESIIPLIQGYYENSLEEVVQSEVITQKLTSDNIKIIRNFTGFTFILSLILFIYVYRSIYTPIKQLKIGAFHLCNNFAECEPIKPNNPHDELGDLTKYFNYTIKRLQEKIIAKSYLDNIINSIDQNLIVMDNENKIEKINSNTAELLGYLESELVGKPISSILSLNNNLDIEDLIQLDDTYDNCLTIDLLTKSHNEIEVKAYFSRLLDSQGNKKGTICLAIEIENLHLSEIALRKSKERAKNNTKIKKNT